MVVVVVEGGGGWRGSGVNEVGGVEENQIF